MQMKSFAKWLKDNYNEEMPKGMTDGTWFHKRGLPLVVECSCCTMTMALPSAFIDDEGNVYCSNCKGD